MGIRGLWKFVKDASTSILPGTLDTIIVDGTMMVINFSMPIRHLEPNVFADVLRKIFVKRMNDLTAFLKTPKDTQKIKFVFDPVEKPAGKIRPRQKLVGMPDYAFDIFYDLMHEHGVDIIECPIGVEADHKMAELASELASELEVVVYTEDSDLLCLTPVVMRFDFSVWRLDDILRVAGITKKNFIDACQMAANDYNDSSMTFVKALKNVLYETST